MTAFFSSNLRGPEGFDCFPSNTQTKKTKNPNALLRVTDNLGLWEAELRSKTAEQRICLKLKRLFFERGHRGVPTSHQLQPSLLRNANGRQAARSRGVCWSCSRQSGRPAACGDRAGAAAASPGEEEEIPGVIILHAWEVGITSCPLQIYPEASELLIPLFKSALQRGKEVKSTRFVF